MDCKGCKFGKMDTECQEAKKEMMADGTTRSQDGNVVLRNKRLTFALSLDDLGEIM